MSDEDMPSASLRGSLRSQSEFRREVLVEPAFDKRPKKPGDTDYGIGCMRHVFVLIGPKGAVQFMCSFGTYLPHVARELWRRADPKFSFKPMGWDVGYHSFTPMYEGHTPTRAACHWLDGATCYYDGSGLMADDWMPEFLAGGTNWLWPKLEEFYRSTFASVSEPAEGGKS